MKTSNATNTTLKRRRLGLVALIALAVVAFGGLRVGARGQRVNLGGAARQTANEDGERDANDSEPVAPTSESNDAAASDDLSAGAVRDSIDGAIAFLRQKQRKSGEWEEYPGYAPGTTSLCALALLTAGLDESDPTLGRALEFLEGVTTARQNQTYPISLQTMVFCQANPEKYRAQIESNVAWLVERQMKTNNEHAGGWSYVGDNQESERADNSNSQFALLALYEAELAGFEIDERVWESAEAYWLRMQNEDGSWGYRASSLNPAGYASGYGTGSMTSAGIAALAICSGVREAARAKLEGDGAICCQEIDDEIATRIARGLAWLGKHFSVQTNPGRAAGSDSYFYYYLYGLERVGRLTANRFIGRSDWYREGAESLLRRKGALSNFWNAQKDLGNNSCVSTSFALLFLSKGRWPILASKLKYGDDDSWNEHPNDLAHLTERVEREWEQKLVWQTIDAKKATVDDLLQSPILVISGVRDPAPKDPAERRRLVENLRGYLEQGGFIFAEAIDGDLSFETGFRALMTEVLERDGADFRLLEPEHPIWSAEKLVPPEFIRPLYGIDFGCRTSVAFAPAFRPKQGANGERPSALNDRPSLSCLWEAASKRPRDDDGATPTARALAEQDAAFTLGVNICAYATNRKMKFKDEIAPDVAEELEKEKNRHNDLFVGLLDCGAGSSCAPRAIPNLMKELRARLGVPAQIYAPRVTARTDELFDYPILFMHGRNAFSFSDEERERLRLYLDRGGFLFVNAVCASERFADAFAEEFEALFPDETLVDVPTDDPIYTGKYGGFKIERLQYNRSKVVDGRRTQSEIVEEAPKLRGLQRGGRWVLLFSPEDVSCALEDSAAVNCRGLTKRSAFYLATNVLFYAAESF